jgi:hypothetical protein
MKGIRTQVEDMLAKNGHHKSGLKRKTTAGTGQSHRRSNQTPTKLSRYYKTFFLR